MSSFSSSLVKRLACDRCHNKKIRCKKAASLDICERCLQGGYQCHYSVPAKTGRPSHHSRELRRARNASEASSSRRATPRHSFSSQETSGSMFHMNSMPTTNHVGFEGTSASADSASYSDAMFYHSGYPTYGQQFSAGTDVMMPPKSVTTEFSGAFQPLMTPASLDQGYEFSSMSPSVATTSSMSIVQYPLSAIFDTTNMSAFESITGYSPVASLDTASDGHTRCDSLDMENTKRQILNLRRILRSCTSGRDIDDAKRVESLLYVAEQLERTFDPYFQLSPQGTNAALSLDSLALSSMLEVLSMTVDTFGHVLNPYGLSPVLGTGQAEQEPSTPPRTVTPQALSAHSPMSAGASPMLAHSGAPVGAMWGGSPVPSHARSFSLAVPVHHLQSMPSTPQRSRATSRSVPSPTPILTPAAMSRASAPIGVAAAPSSYTRQVRPAIAPALSADAIPAAAEVRVGGYVSRDGGLNRWLCASALLYRVRGLKALQERMSVSLRAGMVAAGGAAQAVVGMGEGLEVMGGRLVVLLGQVKQVVQELVQDD